MNCVACREALMQTVILWTCCSSQTVRFTEAVTGPSSRATKAVHLGTAEIWKAAVDIATEAAKKGLLG
jgi:hypothetical protein